MACDFPRERLWEWVHGDEDAETAGHAAKCAACGAAAARMRDLLGDLRDLPSQATSTVRRLGEVIGPYRLMRVLGEGGMGVVYEAQQLTPRRQVALKLIRGGELDDDLRVRLFRREMQALARLNHPNIATIYDAGCTPEGRHYFAMELVEGQPLLVYAGGATGRAALSIRERVRLFHRVCDAIAYAHERGIMHRDVKPSNILVDPSGNPKVLDFGLARSIDRDDGMSQHTEAGRIVGTVPYMSPEQISGRTDQIDVRTDVYALGLLLYELLTGRLPYDVVRKSLFDAIRTISHEPAPDPRVFNRSLPADLCTITLKALEKEPDRRYQTTAELRDDVHRQMTNHPILARRASAWYRWRKFAQRHHIAVALTALLIVVVGASGARLAVQARRLERERNAARDEAEKFRELHSVLTQLLTSADPWSSGAGSKDTRVLDVLDDFARRIQRDVSRPLIAAALRNTLGSTYRRFSEFRKAEEHLRYALQTRESLLGESHPDTLESLRNLGELLFESGDVEGAAPLLLDALRRRERASESDPADLADALNSVGLLHKTRGQLDDGQALLERSLSVYGRAAERAASDADALREVREGQARAMNNLAALHRTRAGELRDGGDEPGASRELERARSLYTDALELRRQWLGPDHPDVAKALNNYAMFLRDIGRNEEAIVHARETLRILRQEVGDESALTARALYNLARLEAQCGRTIAAAELVADATAIQIRVLGPDHAHTRQSQEFAAELSAAPAGSAPTTMPTGP